MEQALRIAQQQTIQWAQDYGYHAVVPALLADPGGVPWAWVFLMLLAAEANKNIALMIVYGIAVLTITDHAGYWLARYGGRPLLQRIEAHRPQLTYSLRQAEGAISNYGSWAILFGRFVPLVGRFVGVGAGLAAVPPARFALFDALGATLTVGGFGLAAHLLGRRVIDAPWFAAAVGGAFLAGTVLTLAGLAWKVWRGRVQMRRNPAPASSCE